MTRLEQLKEAHKQMINAFDEIKKAQKNLSLVKDAICAKFDFYDEEGLLSAETTVTVIEENIIKEVLK